MKNYKLFWVPRVLAIIFILFISLFAFDTFSGEAPFVQELGGFLIHLIPSFILIITLIISWRKPLIAGTIFVLLGLVFTFYFRTYEVFLNFLIVSFPLVLAGVLFIIFHILVKKKSNTHTAKRNPV